MVGGSVGKWSVVGWSVVGGSVVGGFNKTHGMDIVDSIHRMNLQTFYMKYIVLRFYKQNLCSGKFLRQFGQHSSYKNEHYFL